MLRKRTGTDPTPRDSSDDDVDNDRQRRRRLSMGVAALTLAFGLGGGAGLNVLLDKDSSVRAGTNNPEATAPLNPPSETSAPSPETPTTTSTPETTEPATESSEPTPEAFTAPETLNASTVKFQLASGEVITGTENLVTMLEVPYAAGMTNIEYDTELVKRLGILVNINTSNEAISAYADESGGIEGVEKVMDMYGENGAVAEAFGEGRAGVSGQPGVTEYIASVSNYNRQRADETGQDYQCIYIMTEPPTKEVPLNTERMGTGVLTEKCGAVQPDGSLAVERTRNIQMNFNVTIPAPGEAIHLADSSSVSVLE